MSESDGGNGTPGQGEIQTWLLVKLAEELKLDPRSIDVRAPFSHYGLDSMARPGSGASCRRRCPTTIPTSTAWRRI
jgi:Phosphopantetheine attachment site